MIEYSNLMNGESRAAFALRYRLNQARTWWKFHVQFPWVRYRGFVRVMPQVTFSKNMDVSIGHNVQFGIGTDVATNVHFGNNILVAGGVRFVGRQDHTFDVPGQTIWKGARGDNAPIEIEDDVWIGAGSVILSGVKIARGAIVAAPEDPRPFPGRGRQTETPCLPLGMNLYISTYLASYPSVWRVSVSKLHAELLPIFMHHVVVAFFDVFPIHISSCLN